MAEDSFDFRSLLQRMASGQSQQSGHSMSSPVAAQRHRSDGDQIARVGSNSSLSTHSAPSLQAPGADRTANRSSSLLGNAHTVAVDAVAAAAAAGDGTAQRKQGKQPQGRLLHGNSDIVYNVDQRAPGEASPQLEVAPITMYATEPSMELRRFVAVSASYICYGLKAGQIRVLHRVTAARALLRGHTAPITDLSFCPGADDILASTAKDGQLIVWQVSEAADNTLTGHKTLTLQLPTSQDGQFLQLAWHPACQQILFFISGSRVLAAHIAEVTASEQQVDVDVNSLAPGIVCLPPGRNARPLTSLALSTDGSTLAAGTSEGLVHVWRLPALRANTDSSSALVGAVTAAPPLRVFDGGATGSLAWTTLSGGRAALLVGDSCNAQLALHVQPSVGGDMVPAQTLHMTSSAVGSAEMLNHLVVVAAAGLVVLANAKRKSVYVLHLTGGNEERQAGFDYLAEFAIASPMLSVAALDAQEAPVQLFCVQPTAVQQYMLDPALCQPEPSTSSAHAQPPLSPAHSLGRAASPSPPPRAEPTQAPAPAPTVCVSPLASGGGRSPSFGTSAASSSNGGEVAAIDVSASPEQQQHLAGGNGEALHAAAPAAATEEQEVATPPATAPSSLLTPPPSAPSSQPRLLTPKQLMSQVSASQSIDGEGPPLSPSSSVASLSGVSTQVVPPASSAGNAVGPATPGTAHEAEVDSGAQEAGTVRLLKRARPDSNRETPTQAAVAVPRHSAPAAASPAAPSPETSHTQAASPAMEGSSRSAATAPSAASEHSHLVNELLEAQAGSQRRLVAHLNANFRDVLKAMRSELAKETRRMEATMDARLARALQSSAQLLKAEREAAEAAQKQEVQQLAAAVSQNLAAHLPGQLEEALRHEFSSLSAGIGAAVSPAVRAAIAQAPLPQATPAAAPAAAVNEKEIADRLQAGLAKPLGAALRSAVERQLLPPLERALSEAFRQVDSSLAAGLREHLAANAAPAAAATQSLQACLQEASAVAATMKADLADGQRQLLALAAAGASAAALPAATPAVAAVDPKTQLAALLQDRKYEEAFTQALSLSDVSIVAWLCSQLDPALLSQEPAVVSQGVLLSLLQQLGTDLPQLPGSVLPWIREAALALDPQDPLLASHMRPILDELFRALQARAAGTTGQEASMLRLVIHVVNSLRMACR